MICDNLRLIFLWKFNFSPILSNGKLFFFTFQLIDHAINNIWFYIGVGVVIFMYLRQKYYYSTFSSNCLNNFICIVDRTVIQYHNRMRFTSGTRSNKWQYKVCHSKCKLLLIKSPSYSMWCHNPLNTKSTNNTIFTSSCKIPFNRYSSSLKTTSIAPLKQMMMTVNHISRNNKNKILSWALKLGLLKVHTIP